LARVLMWVCTSAVVLIGLLTLVEYLTGNNLRLDGLLFKKSLALQAKSFPGRPSPHTAFSFLIIGVALSIIKTKNTRAYGLAQVLALFVALIAAMALVGYLYQLAFLYSITSYTGMGGAHRVRFYHP
jgi:hypothetical protein